MPRSSQVISSGGQLTHSPRAPVQRKSSPITSQPPLPVRPAALSQLISTQDSSASGLVPHRIESPVLSGHSLATTTPLTVIPFIPRLVIHHWPLVNVNLPCSRDTVGTSGSPSSTAPRPARAPDIVVSATESPVTSRSTGTGLRLCSTAVGMSLTAPRDGSGPARVLPSWAVKPGYGDPAGPRWNSLRAGWATAYASWGPGGM